MSANSWWAEKIGVTQPQPSKSNSTGRTTPWWETTTPQTHQNNNNEVALAPDEEIVMGGYVSNVVARQRAIAKMHTEKGVKINGYCPACGSSNYASMPSPEGGNIMSTSRCFDCGYPAVQSSSGDMSPTFRGNNSELVQPTRQVETQTYKPNQIVDHIK